MRCLAVWMFLGLGFAGIPQQEFAARRAAVRKALGGGVAVLAGAAEGERGGLRAPFFQEPNFLYLTGWREPGAMLVLAPEEEALFLPKRNEIRDRYTGRKVSAGDADAAARTGFAHVYEDSQLQAKLGEWMKGRKVHALGRTPGFERVQDAAGRIEFEELSRTLARLRMVKSPAELALIRKSVDTAVSSHKAAWRRVRAGLHEYQVAATMTNIYFEAGCERSAYPPIVASGPNAVILHYMSNRRRMDSGELLLMDVGAECSGYASDITRTIPVNGKFTRRQREIYEIVLGAQKAALAAARPGVKLLGTGADTLNGIALNHVRKFGLDKYYLHALGHHVGLEVHDAADPDLPLAAGMTVTFEPGIYIAGEAIGVRIEDVVEITAHGARLLSEHLPREPSAIEKIMSNRR